jgi:hypothetical protein
MIALLLTLLACWDKGDDSASDTAAVEDSAVEEQDSAEQEDSAEEQPEDSALEE